ncbi:MAG: hypothetical protein ACRC80_08440 [Waterburya sp.]
MKLQRFQQAAVSLALLGGMLGSQLAIPATKIQIAQSVLELGSDKAEAVTAIERKVQEVFNKNYVNSGETSSWGFYSKEYDRYLSKTGKLHSFVSGISYEIGRGKSEAETKAAVREALRLYDKYISKTIEDSASKLYGKHAGKTANMMWRLGVEVYTYTSVRLDSSGSSQQMALFKPMYGKALKLGKLNLDMQAIAYRDELQLLVTKGNANGASVVQFGLEALQRDLQNRGKFSMIPINNIGGGGWLELPTGDISLQPIASNGIQPIGQGSNYYYDMYQRDLKKYRYTTVIPDLLEANARGVETMRANGLRQEDSIVFLAATFFDLFFEMAPSSNMGATRRMVATLPESQLNRLAKSSRNSSRAGKMLDDVRGGKKPTAEVPKKNQSTLCASTGSLVAGMEWSNRSVLVASSSFDIVSDSGGILPSSSLVAVCTPAQKQLLSQIDSEIAEVAGRYTKITEKNLSHVIQGEVYSSNSATQATGLHHLDTLLDLRSSGLIEVVDTRGKVINATSQIVDYAKKLDPIRFRFKKGGALSQEKTFFPDGYTIDDIARIGNDILEGRLRKLPDPNGKQIYLTGDGLKVIWNNGSWYPIK